MNLARAYALAFGVVYTLVGILGFLVAPGLEPHDLILFPVNGPHNLVHLLVGLAGIGLFLAGRAIAYARGMAVLFAILVVAGFLPQPLLGLVPLGGPDIVLHALTAVLAAAAGWMYQAQVQPAH